MIQNVHISGAFKRAIFLKDGDYFLKKLDQPSVLARHFDINTLLQFGGDIVVLEKTKENELNELIQEQSELQSGLRLAIKGISPRTPINDEFRQPHIELLEEYLEDTPVYNFVYTRMVSKAATDDTDIAEALRIAQTHNYTKAMQLYTDLQAAQPTLQVFWDLWKQVTYDVSEEELIEIEDDLLQSGVFAKAIELLKNVKNTDDINVILFEVPQRHARIFQKIAQQFIEKQEVIKKSAKKPIQPKANTEAIFSIHDSDGKKRIIVLKSKHDIIIEEDSDSGVIIIEDLTNGGISIKLPKDKDDLNPKYERIFHNKPKANM